MTTQLEDKTGAPVTIRLVESRPVGTYAVHLADGTPAGRAYFVDSPETTSERIFFHTEVDQEFSGRGLAGLLVREALADSISRNLTVVPVCPLFASHLETSGDQFVADGGRFRRPTSADVALVKRAVGEGNE
jgi:uncharacterized protein